MVVIKQTGNFNNTDRFLSQSVKTNYRNILDRYGREGVEALASATPIDSGLTADSWGYEISISPRGSYQISWTNSNVVDGTPVVILLQYGHGTKNGGYVQGQDFINPAIRPIFDKIATDVWKEVTRL